MSFFLKKNILLSILILSIFVISCRDKEKITISTNFDQLDDKKLKLGDTLPLEFNADNATIDSYSVTLNNKPYTNQKEIVLDSTNAKMGTNYFVLTVNYNSKYKKEIDATFTLYSSIKEKTATTKIIKEYPHNPELFTQGFSYKNGVITESSGQYEKSKLVRYPLGSTDYSQSVSIDPKIFAEGFAIKDNKLYLLSWKERVCLVYNESDFSLINQIQYPAQLIEGWGASSIGDDFVFSDSSANLKILDSDFKFKKELPIIGSEKVYPNLNELEYANGHLYANVFGQPVIVILDPKTGSVVAVADFSDLVKENQHDSEAVLNGIAHVGGNNFLITGKLWSKIYMVEISF